MTTILQRSAAAALACILIAAVVSAGDDSGRGTASERNAAAAALEKTGGGTILEVVTEPGSSSFLIISGSDRYDVRVDAESGEVTGLSRRPVSTVKPQPRGMAGRDTRLDSRDAESAALALTGGGTIVKSDREARPAGGKVFHVEIVSGSAKYAVDIDADSGELVRYHEQPIRGADHLAFAER